MSSTAVQRLQEALARFEAKDIEGVVGLFAPDGVFADPHYPPPIGPSMSGHAAIREALTWSLGLIEQAHFAIRHELSGVDSDPVAALEVDTNHKLHGGPALTFTQVFIAGSTTRACSVGWRATRRILRRPHRNGPPHQSQRSSL